jgi:thiol-disulfide isomerase/thioredoxin
VGRFAFSGRKGTVVALTAMNQFKCFYRTVLLGAVLLVAGFDGVVVRAQDASALTVAPAWKLKDLAGREVSSEQFKGKVVVLDFWATWCVPCIGEIPGYIELQKKYGAQGLMIVGVSVDQKGPDVVAKFAKAKGMNYTIVMADDAIADAFGGFDVIPTTFLINRDGRIIHRKAGAMPHEEYEKLVQQALQ